MSMASSSMVKSPARPAFTTTFSSRNPAKPALASGVESLHDRAAMNSIRLYDLATRDDRRPSPYCWRAKYALAHKGLPFETVAVGFTDISTLFDGGYKTVPILEDGGEVIADSWAIADYLDQSYPDRPRLFGSATERALCRFLEASLAMSANRHVVTVAVMDIHDHLRDSDQAYFRASREKRLGRSLEEVVAGREARLETVRAGYDSLRLTLEHGEPFLSGAAPGYADYIAAGALLWPASVLTVPLLRSDDPLLPWLHRVQDLYGGLGRESPLYPISEQESSNRSPGR
jgi:glutathione S-transferase